MHRSTVLFHTCETTPDDEIRTAAEEAAKYEMHLSVMLHGEMPTLPMNAYGTLPYSRISVPDAWPNMLRARQKQIVARGEEIEAMLSEASVSGDVRTLWCVEGDIQEHVSHSAQVADYAFFAKSLRDSPDIFREMLHGVLFRSPIGAFLNATPGLARRQIFVAWDQSPAATRAVHLALPVLKEADRVTIACFDPPAISQGQKYEPGVALAGWLSHHGCAVTVSQYTSGGLDISSAIKDRAAELGADLVVLGAYGHSRMRQAVFGGTTRSLVEQADIPIFLAH